jgi:outer membrane protein assembly factor BamB
MTNSACCFVVPDVLAIVNASHDAAKPGEIQLDLVDRGSSRPMMIRLMLLAVVATLARPGFAQQNTNCVNPTSDLGVEFYAQAGVVVDGIAYFTSDDGGCVKTGIRSPSFHSVVAFDVHTLRKVRTYHFGQTYDSSPFLFQKQDGTWLVIAHEHTNQRTAAFQRDTAELEWTSADNQPGNYFFGYSSCRLEDGKQLILMACRNGLHAMSGETGEDVWWLRENSTGGVTPCVDQERGWIFYQCDGKVLKVRATDGEVLQSVSVGTPTCIRRRTLTDG